MKKKATRVRDTVSGLILKPEEVAKRGKADTITEKVRPRPLQVFKGSYDTGESKTFRVFKTGEGEPDFIQTTPYGIKGLKPGDRVRIEIYKEGEATDETKTKKG